jgi:hypothetical protein
VACKGGNLLHVARLGMRGKIAHLHIVSHALAKGCNGRLLCERDVLQAAFPWFRKGSHVRSYMWLGDVDALWRVLIGMSASATA